MPDADDDLRATTDDIAADARRLEEIETEKGRMDPADPRAAELAAEGERLAREILPKTIAQREITSEAQAGS